MDLSKINWRVVVGVFAVLLFGARIIISIKQRENRKEQQLMFQEMSKMQRSQAWGNYSDDSVLKQSLEINISETIKSLDSAKKDLEDIGKRLDSLK